MVYDFHVKLSWKMQKQINSLHEVYIFRTVFDFTIWNTCMTRKMESEIFINDKLSL